MKYVISNKQLFNSIYSYIESELQENNKLVYSQGFDYDQEKYVDTLLWFYIEGEDDWVFEYVYSDYWQYLYKKNKNDEWLKSKRDKSPMLEFSHSFRFLHRMNNIFGDIWKPVFEQWFIDNFSEIPKPKTFVY